MLRIFNHNLFYCGWGGGGEVTLITRGEDRATVLGGNT